MPLQARLNKGSVPIFTWIHPTKIEDGALKQAIDLSNLPFAFSHVAIMPDTHQGFGMPIGAVLATTDVVIPNAVGVDIGCGMHAFKTNLTVEQVKPYVSALLKQILKAVPVGFAWHKKPLHHPLINATLNKAPNLPVIHKHIKKAAVQLGTLGSGNHFIEIQAEDPLFVKHLQRENRLPKDYKPRVWVMLHTGSRNIGKQIAGFYYKKAMQKLERMPASFKMRYPSRELAFLELGTPQGDNYIKAMNFAQQYALANRQIIADTIKNIFKKFFSHFRVIEEYDIHHNFAQFEKHTNLKSGTTQQVLVHRKGATFADEGRIGIIPGSMGSASYITIGQGNKIAFNTSSHGAGRIMGRKASYRKYTLADVKNALNKIEVQVVTPNPKALIEESPMVYKNIDEIMQLQDDLVHIKMKLSPLGTVKG